MSKTTNPREQLANVFEPQRLLYMNVAALRDVAEQIETPLVNRASSALPIGVGDVWAPANYATNLLPNIDERLPHARAALAVLESSKEYQEAAAVIEPLLKAVAELEAAEANTAVAFGRANKRHSEALASAEAKALEVARQDPAVMAAAHQLSELSAK